MRFVFLNKLRLWTNVFKVWRHHIYLSIAFVLILLTNSYAARYSGFDELQESKCTLLNDKDFEKLPTTWHKYKGFVKICELKQNRTSKPKVSIISIWAYDYLGAWTKASKWEDFPLTIIVDDRFNHLGTFPELYPMDLRTEPSVYYEKWKSGIPTEIRIDVYNPTVSGDYYYSPLIWNEKDGQYHMKTKESKSGKRPK